MGIDKFYNQFNKTFNLVYNIDNNDNFHNKLDDYYNLLFDFNSTIYNVSYELTKYNITDLKNIINNYDLNIDDDDIIVKIICYKVIHKLYDHIINTININDNTKINLYIFLDGVPSINKMNEQRQRRFMTVLMMEYEKHDNNKNTERYTNRYEKILDKIKRWDLYKGKKISPQTGFIKILENYFDNNFNKIPINNDMSFHHDLNNLKKIINFMYIDKSSNYDEAEIKLVKYIKNNKKYFENNKSIIYSPDADFILLTMSLHIKYINVIKIEFTDKYKYNFIMIDKLKNILVNNIKLIIKLITYIYDNKSLFNDLLDINILNNLNDIEKHKYQNIFDLIKNDKNINNKNNIIEIDNIN
jgi:5'-3' exonuclease